MFENQWTGIPIVTSELVRCAVADPDASWTYLYQNIIVDRAVVEEMLARRRGGDYLAHLERQLWAQATLDHDDAAKGACIFPNVKPLRNVFRSESLILHDLSTLLTPEFHNLRKNGAMVFDLLTQLHNLIGSQLTIIHRQTTFHLK